MSNDNKYLTKICALLQPPKPPRSETVGHKKRLVKKPKLHKFVYHANSSGKYNKPSK